MTTINVLAIDPAFRNVGLCLATLNISTNEFKPYYIGLIQTEADKSKKVRVSSDRVRRAKIIYDKLEGVIKSGEVKYVLAEIPSGGQNAAAANQLGIVTGVVASLSKPLIEVSPLEVKKATGYTHKKISKKEMIAWAMGKYPDLNWKMRKSKGEIISNDGKNEHMADAVAVLEASLVSEQWRGIRTAISTFI